MFARGFIETHFHKFYIINQHTKIQLYMHLNIARLNLLIPS